MKLRYKAFDKNGRAVSATVEAADAVAAMETLRRDGLYVSELSEAGGDAFSEAPRRSWLRGGRRLRNLSVLARQLHVLLASGTPLVQSLSAIERQMEDAAWRAVVAELRHKVEEGAALSEAMAGQGEHFDSVARSLVAAGESGGNMAEALERLSSLARKQLHLRNSIIGAMVYPAVLLGVGVAVVLVMMLFVLPRFAGMFQTLDVPLPPTTRFLVASSEMLIGWWWVALLMVCGAGLVVRGWLRSQAGRRAVHTAMLRLPKVGQLVKNLITARLARLLGALLQSRVPLVTALELVKQAMGNVHYVRLLENAEEAVTRGESISVAFADVRLITPSVYEMMRTGEQSGQIGPLLLHTAEFLDEENEVVVRSLTSILEPVILIVLGVVVAFIALSLFLPLFDLTAMTQGGGG